jgi:hypothetical protein
MKNQLIVPFETLSEKIFLQPKLFHLTHLSIRCPNCTHCSNKWRGRRPDLHCLTHHLQHPPHRHLRRLHFSCFLEKTREKNDYIDSGDNIVTKDYIDYESFGVAIETYQHPVPLTPARPTHQCAHKNEHTYTQNEHNII